MKKVICLFVFAFFGSVVMLFSRDITITHINSNANIKFHEEKHKDGCWFFSKPSSELKEEDNGNLDSMRAFSIDPITMTDMVGPSGKAAEWKDLYSYALEQIKNNNPRGKLKNNIVIDNDVWRRSVEWAAIDKYTLRIIIHINLDEE